jgi:hypothetical protein
MSDGHAPDRISSGYESGRGPAPQFIVAEISKNWPGDIDDLLSMRFEDVLGVNQQRGYRLHSWRLSRVRVGRTLNETIIAVFERSAIPSTPQESAADG